MKVACEPSSLPVSRFHWKGTKVCHFPSLSLEAWQGEVRQPIITRMLSYRNGIYLKGFLPILLLVAASIPGTLFADADPMQEAGATIIQKYNEALIGQQSATRNIAMTVTIEGRIPRLKKAGTLNALRRISSLGHVTYKALGFQGDDMVKREVIARYMTAEQDATGAAASQVSNLAINPENYHFKYKGVNYRDGRPVHLFELKPKAKRVGLFKGELWLDPETSLPVREQGQFVKNPSVFVKKMEFARDYQIENGVSLLKHMEAKTDTRLVGVAELAIDCNRVERTEEVPVEEASTNH